MRSELARSYTDPEVRLDLWALLGAALEGRYADAEHLAATSPNPTALLMALARWGAHASAEHVGYARAADLINQQTRTAVAEAAAQPERKQP